MPKIALLSLLRGPKYTVMPPDFPGTKHFAHSWIEAMEWIAQYPAGAFREPLVVDRAGRPVRYAR